MTCDTVVTPGPGQQPSKWKTWAAAGYRPGTWMAVVHADERFPEPDSAI